MGSLVPFPVKKSPGIKLAGHRYLQLSLLSRSTVCIYPLGRISYLQVCSGLGRERDCLLWSL